MQWADKFCPRSCQNCGWSKDHRTVERQRDNLPKWMQVR